MATKVESSSNPLARESCASGMNSGRMPYFAGLKKFECVASRKSTTSNRLMLDVVSAQIPISMMKISKLLVIWRTRVFEKRSAIWPEVPAKSRKGSTNTAPAIAR